MRLAPGADKPGRGRLWDVWRSGLYIGDDAPRARLTVQRARIFHPSTDRGRWGNIHFTGTREQRAPVELPNIMSIQIDPAVDQDAATCTIQLANTKPREFGDRVYTDDFDIDLPGWYTFNRGDQGSYNRWEHERNEWHNVLIENRVLRTYQGYGVNPFVDPHLDDNLMQTGTWMIDEVKIGSNKIITITCRDMAKPLIESICFPPVIPPKHYPISFEARPKAAEDNEVANPSRLIGLRFAQSSNQYFSGNTPEPQFPGSMGVHGHTGAHAFDGKDSSYWLSVGSDSARGSDDFHWLEADAQRKDISAVRFTPWRGNYVVYVSVMVKGKWIGDQTIPYVAPGGGLQNNQSAIKYLKKTTVGDEQHTIRLGQVYRNVQRIRLTFTSLARTRIGGVVRYRAGVREFSALLKTRKATKVKPEDAKKGVILYDDYTDIVKYFVAVGGGYWPPNATARLSATQLVNVPPDRNEPILGAGAAWGDFELTKTNGPERLPASEFDKKPLMDGITKVKDVVGFVFFFDEEGGAVFRSPNIWRVGNYLKDNPNDRPRTGYVPEIDEKLQLKELEATISGANQRKRVIVAKSDGSMGAMVDGREANPMGLERVGIWTDQSFKTRAECRVMADLIVSRQLFTRRTDSVTIPGCPMIGPDDQVRLWERVTGEAYIHYIRGLSSSFDNVTGEYTMTLNTHWLGERPEGKWVIDFSRLHPDTKRYLNALGKTPTRKRKKDNDPTNDEGWGDL